MENSEIENGEISEIDIAMDQDLQGDFSDITRRLPLELWLEILNYIDHVKDIKNLTLVSKTWYEIVNKLDEAMKLLVLRLHRKMMSKVQEQLLKSTRRYKSIQLHSFGQDVKLSAFPEVIEKLGQSLRILKFVDCELTEKELIDVLKLSQEHLTTLYIINSKIEKMSDYTHESFKLNMLEDLDIDDESNDTLSVLFDHIPDTCNRIYGWYDQQNLVPLLANVVEKQKNLKKLEIYTSVSSFDESWNDPKITMLKLETLIVHSYGTSRFQDANGFLQKFLKSQVAGLRELALHNLPIEEYADIFKFMPNLKILEFGDVELCPSFAHGKKFVCPALIMIILDFSFTKSPSSSYENLFKRFANKNVNTIEMRYKVNSDVLKMIAEAFPNIITIHFGRFNDDSLKFVDFDDVEELIISGVAKKVTIDHTFKLEKITDMDYTLKAMENLKILRFLGNVQIDSKLLVWLLINLTELEELQIDNGLQLDDLYKLSKQFKNLKLLSIANYRGNDIDEFRQRLMKFKKLKCFRVTPKLPFSEFNYYYKHPGYHYSSDMQEEMSESE